MGGGEIVNDCHYRAQCERAQTTVLGKLRSINLEQLNASGDGIDSNGAIHQSGGDLQINGPENGGNGAIDAQNGMTISGGRLLAAGSVGMDEAPRLSSGQASVKFAANVSAGEKVAIYEEGSQQAIAEYDVSKNAGSFVFSDPAVIAEKTYVLKVDGSEVAQAKAGDYQEMNGGPGGAPGGQNPPDVPQDGSGGGSWPPADGQQPPQKP